MTVNTSCTPTENINEPLVIKTKLMLPTCIQWLLTLYLWDIVRFIYLKVAIIIKLKTSCHFLSLVSVLKSCDAVTVSVKLEQSTN